SGRDPAIYLAVATLVIIVSLVATFVPARRATRVDPMIALRAEEAQLGLLSRQWLAARFLPAGPQGQSDQKSHRRGRHGRPNRGVVGHACADQEGDAGPGETTDGGGKGERACAAFG